jgi:hypothetical protein
VEVIKKKKKKKKLNVAKWDDPSRMYHTKSVVINGMADSRLASRRTQISPRASSSGETSTDQQLELAPLSNGGGASSEDSGGEPAGKELRWEAWKGVLIVCLLWAVGVFTSSAYSIVGSFFPIKAAKKGSGPFTTGVIIGASPLAMVIFTPLCGYFLPKLGIKFAFIAGIVLVGGAYFLMGFLADMPSGTVFIVFGILLRLTEGVGWTMSTVSSFALVSHLYPSRVGTITGILLGGGGLGFTIGPPVGSVLATVGGYRAPFLIVGGLTLLFIPPSLLLIKPISSSSHAYALSQKKFLLHRL